MIPGKGKKTERNGNKEKQERKQKRMQDTTERRKREQGMWTILIVRKNTRGEKVETNKKYTAASKPNIRNK